MAILGWSLEDGLHELELDELRQEAHTVYRRLKNRRLDPTTRERMAHRLQSLMAAIREAQADE